MTADATPPIDGRRITLLPARRALRLDWHSDHGRDAEGGELDAITAQTRSKTQPKTGLIRP